VICSGETGREDPADCTGNEKGRSMAEWFEKFFDGLFAEVLPNWFDESQTREDVRIVKRLLGLRKGQRVLDIPCGMGRLTIPMARMGLAMTGVDLTASYVRRARRDAKQEALDIRFVCCDMRDTAFDGEFDAAFNWWGSFGYFSDADNLRFCKLVFQALRPGGRFLIEGPNKSWILAHFRPRYERTIGGVRIVERGRWDARTGRVLSIWTFHRGRVSERRRVSMRIYNGAEMRSLLRASGFREIALFGHPPLGRFTRHSQRLIAVGRKPLRGRMRRQ
jgi:SAM-dependent methyltransferase